MGNNLTINDKNIAKVITVLKYVNISFNETADSTKQIPGTSLETPFIDVLSIGTDDDYKFYKLLYGWSHLGVDAPLLVPNVDTTYEANWCSIKATNSNITLTVDEYNHQFQSPSFYIISDEPLYFRGETYDNVVKKNVKIDSVVLLDSNNKYKMTVNTYINGTISGISSAIDGESFWSGFAEGAANGFMSGAIIGGITGAISSGLQVAKAASYWDKGTFSSGYKSMKYHYTQEVVNKGLTKGNSIVKYTNDAVKFANNNGMNFTLNLSRNGLQNSWSLDKYFGSGANGLYTSSGNIITFHYFYVW